MTAVAPARVGDGTRAEIRRIALELFAEQGFDGTSLQQIADRLGVTKAALYYHFKSKDDLLAAVVEPMITSIETVLGAADSAMPGTRRQQLASYIDCLLENREVLGFLSRDLAVLGRPAVAQRMLHLRDRITTAIAGTDLSLENRVRVTFALNGLQGAIIAHSTADVDELRGPVTEGVDAVLRLVRRDIAARARTGPACAE